MTTKKAAASAEKRAKAAKKKTSGKLRKPTVRQTKLIKGVVGGQSVRQAALAAGYSPNTAEHAGELLSTEALRAFCQSRLSLDKILLRVDEGMDAELSQTLVLGRKGKETVRTVTYPHHSERRQAAALAARLYGADPSVKIDVRGDINTFVKVIFEDVAASTQP